MAHFQDPTAAHSACRFLYKAVVGGADLITTLVDPQDLPVSGESLDAEKKLIMSHFDKIAGRNFADLPPPPHKYKPQPDVPDPSLLSTSDFEIKARSPLSPLSASTDYGTPLSPLHRRYAQGISPQSSQSMHPVHRSSSFASFTSRLTDPVQQRSPALSRVSQAQFVTPVKQRASYASFQGQSPARSTPSSSSKHVDSARAHHKNSRETWRKDAADSSIESPIASPWQTPARRRSNASMSSPVVSALMKNRKDPREKKIVPQGNRLTIESLAEGERSSARR